MLRSDRTPFVGVMVGRGTSITEADDAFLEIIGYTREDLDSGSIDWASMTPPEYRHLDEAEIQQGAATGGFNVPYQKQFLRKDGSRVPVMLVWAFLSVEDDRWMGYVVDLSAPTSPQVTPPATTATPGTQPHDFLARLVEELVRERTRTQAMLDSASATIWAVDRDYRLISENLTFRNGQEAASGRRIAIGESLLGDDDPEEIRAFWKEHYDRSLAGERHTSRWDDRVLGPETFDYTFSPIIDPSGRVVGVTVEGVDVTAEVAAEVALQASEARFRSIFEHAGDVSFMTDSEYRITFVTETVREVFGYEPDDAIGRRMWSVFDATAIEPNADLVAQALAESGARVSVHARMVDSSGEPRWIEAVILNLLDDPAVRGYAGNVRDVTDEYRAARLLEYQSSLLGIAGRLARVGGWAVEAGTMRATLSDELIPLLDLDQDSELRLSEGIGLYTEDSRPILERVFDRCFADGTPFDVEVEMVTRLHRHLWLRVMGEPQFDTNGQVVAIQGAIADVSERRVNEMTLRRQATLLDKATDAIIERDLTGRVSYWNHAAELLYGWTPAEAIGAQLPDLIYQGGRDSFDEINATILARGEWSGRRLHFRRDGRQLWIEIHINLVRDDAGTPIGVFSIGSDVTERVELEERLALSQRLEAVGQLTGGIAHDFNNLLTVIIGGSELLAAQLADDDDLGPLASLVHAAAERGSQLTSRLLSFARRQALQPKVVEPVGIVGGMRDLILRSLSETIDVIVDHDEHVWMVSVDPSLLEAALMNVAINARDAMPHGGTLTIHLSNATLDADQVAVAPDTPPGDYVLIRVTDDGEGMSAEVLSRAFDPFFTTKEVGRGSGLGLSMVYGFIKQSGGNVEISSEPGRGTVIDLYLPRAMEPPTPEVPRMARLPMPVGTETVFVVEDNALVRAHASRLLRELGYRVLEASDGPSALEILRTEESIDLLFTDIVMPRGMSGTELAQRALEVRPKLRVLYTSGYTEHSMVLSGALDPRSHLLTKPYHRDELATRIREALDAPRG